jgi:hypothetical protein
MSHKFVRNCSSRLQKLSHNLAAHLVATTVTYKHKYVTNSLIIGTQNIVESSINKFLFKKKVLLISSASGWNEACAIIDAYLTDRFHV